MANLVTSNEVVLGEKKGGRECLNQTEAWIWRPLQEHFVRMSLTFHIFNVFITTACPDTKLTTIVPLGVLKK
jgi:hypothetical protein